VSKHARLSASSAHRWLRCAGSVKAGEGLPDSASVYAAAGTYAHHIAAEGLTHSVFPEAWLGNRMIIDGHVVTCDQEMVDAIRTYMQAVDGDMQPGDELWTEMPLLQALQSVDKDLGGTADHVRYRPSTKDLRVFDFKFGSGMYVDVDANEQMMMYALGVMLQIKKPVANVTVTVVQPRYEAAAPVRDYSFKGVDILDFAADVIAAADKTRLSAPPLAAGDWCSFCRAARTCPELEKKQHALVVAEFSNIVAYDPAKLAVALAAVPLVKERIKAIEEFAYAEATKGRDIPGFKLVDKRANRSWKNDGDVIEWAEMVAVDPYKTAELLSPAQMEKKAKVPAELFESKSSGTTLVPASDKRPPAKLLTAEDFDIIGG